MSTMSKQTPWEEAEGKYFEWTVGPPEVITEHDLPLWNSGAAGDSAQLGFCEAYLGRSPEPRQNTFWYGRGYEAGVRARKEQAR